MALHLDLSPQYHGSAEVFLLFVCVEILRTGFSEKRRESHSGTEEQGRGLQFCCHLFYRRDGMLLQRQFLMGRHWFSCNHACSRARLGHRIVVPWTQGVRWCCGECQCSSPFLFPWRTGCTLLQGRSHFLEREKHDGHGWSSCSMRKGWRMGDSVWKKMALQVLTAAPGTTRREVVKKREPKTRSISWTKPERFRWCTWRRIQGGRGVGCPQRPALLWGVPAPREHSHDQPHLTLVLGCTRDPEPIQTELFCDHVIPSPKLSLWKVAVKPLLTVCAWKT